MKKVTENKIAENFYKLFIIALALGVATYAWLTNSTNMNVIPLAITTSVYTDIEISVDNGQTWASRLDIGIDDNFVFKSDVTGSGYVLNKAQTKDSSGFPLTFTEAVKNEDYLEFDLMFRSKGATSVFLEKESAIKPYVGILESDLIGNSVLRKSSFGDYSRDLIAGAVRVAFMEYDYNTDFIFTNNIKLTWAPNPNYHMMYIDGEYFANINSFEEQHYEYVNVTNNLENGFLKNVNLKDTIKSDHQSKNSFGDPIVSSVNNKIGEYNVSKLKVRIWVEGNDRDAIVALKGGLFKVDLRFVGINKKENLSVPSVSLNLENKLVGFNNLMEYSIDYGNNWISYQDISEPEFYLGDVIWVRYSEKEDTFASNYKELEV